MKIISAASAFPKNYYPQRTLLDALQRQWSGQLRSPQMLERLHTNTRVEGRYLALPMTEY
jgi:predicted naringenin-chalcone synthase